MRTVHLWFGLGLGGIFLLLGLTGSALVFYEGIDAALHPEIRVTTELSAPAWASPVWDRALDTLHTRWPERKGGWRFEATGRPGPLAVRYQPPHAGHHDTRVMIWLSPDGTTVLREAVWGEYLMTFLYDLHMRFALGETGHAAVGWIGVALVLLMVTGLWAWWPRGSWRKALRYKRDAAPSRRLRDIHKLSGLAGLTVLPMLAVTGAMLALPRQAESVMVPLLGPTDKVTAPRSGRNSGSPITLHQVLAIAHRRMPLARLAWLEAPGAGDGAFMVRLQQPGDPSFRFPHSYIYVDQYDGRILSVQDSRKAAPATVVTNWLHPLHDGSIGGLPLRILLSIAGFLPAVLCVTGVMRWHKRQR
ncbi:MAG: PepSY-associated TM helix domain-containing protein [Novosphingobium sp.]